jgi:hypothetical protein
MKQGELPEDMCTILTEQEVKNSLAIKQYPMKYKKALEYARRQNDERMFWTNVRKNFLESGGLLKHQLYNNGKNTF